ASIAGKVSRDDDNDGSGDRNLVGITVNLLDQNGNTVATTVTDANGNYLFEDVTPGDYTIVQENSPNFVDARDVQGANDSQIELTVGIGENFVGQNFIDEIPGSIAGSVSRDDDRDGDGDSFLEGVTVELINDVSDTVATATTDANGEYLFADVTPGDYQVKQTNLTGYGDVTANVVAVELGIGETSTENNFIDELGRIGGNVKSDDDDNGTGDRNLENVTVELLDSNGDVIATALTNTQGNYEFTDLLAGDYQVRQINLTGYGDVTDTVLDVTLGAGESISDRNFVDELGHISGNVQVDDDDDGTGDRNLENVTVELLDNNGDVVATTTTNTQGDYEFSGVVPGNYQVRQVNLTGYGDVTDTVLDITIGAGETVANNDFVDELGHISGNVKSDDDDNDTGDTNLAGVTVELIADGNIISTTITDGSGDYQFDDLLPGDYQVRQINLTGYGDVTDTVLDITIGAGETSIGNDFVDELGHISGNVKSDDDDNGTGDTNLAGVTVELIDSNGNVLSTTTTDVDGNYEFSDILPGNYQVRQTNLTGYGDVTPTTVNINLGAGETNTGNDFVDELGHISGNVKS
ncbi:MAG: SdrD B-like domain-containing protein, partial [Cyanobacteria bacterium J06582_2]